MFLTDWRSDRIDPALFESHSRCAQKKHAETLVTRLVVRAARGQPPTDVVSSRRFLECRETGEAGSCVREGLQAVTARNPSSISARCFARRFIPSWRSGRRKTLCALVGMNRHSNRHTPKGSARCVQSFDDSLDFAIRMTYRISLRSSSLWEPRHPLLKVF